MARLKYNGLTSTLGGALTSTDTTITFNAALTHSGGTAVPTITGPDYIPLTILATSDPDSAVSEIVYLTAYTAGATTGTITRAQESTTGVAHSSGVVVVHGPTTLDFAGGSSSGGTLGSAEKADNAATATSSGADADVDATSLSITFTVPSSGAVVVTQSGLSFSTGGAFHAWTIRDGTTTVSQQQVGAVNFTGRATALHRITGLTPGAVKTYKWGHYRGAGVGTSTIYTGGNSGTVGTAVMTVEATP